MSDADSDLFNLAMSEEAQPLMAAVLKHIKDNVEPITEEFAALEKQKEDRWSWHPRQLELLDGAKAKAKLQRAPLRLFVICVLAAGFAPPTLAQGDAPLGEWRHHGGDLASSKYSPLSQIDGSNFAELRVAWRWESADGRLEESVSIEINGVAHIQFTINDPERGLPFWESLCHFMGMHTLIRNDETVYCIGGRTGLLARAAPAEKRDKTFDQLTAGSSL